MILKNLFTTKKAIMKEYKAYKLYLSSYSAQINPF